MLYPELKVLLDEIDERTQSGFSTYYHVESQLNAHRPGGNKELEASVLFRTGTLLISLAKYYRSKAMHEASRMDSIKAYDLIAYAKKFFSDCCEIGAELNHDGMRRRALFESGNCEFMLGEFAKARNLYQLALTFCTTSQADEIRFRILNSIGNCYIHLEDFEDAETFHRKAHELSCRLDDPLAQGNQLIALGNVMANSEKYSAALDYYAKGQKQIAEVLNQEALRKKIFIDKDEISDEKMQFMVEDITEVIEKIKKLHEQFASLPKKDKIGYRHSRHYKNILRNIHKEEGDGWEKRIKLIDEDWPQMKKGQEWTLINARRFEVAMQLCVQWARVSQGDVIRARISIRERMRWNITGLRAAEETEDKESIILLSQSMASDLMEMGWIDDVKHFIDKSLSYSRELFKKEGEGQAFLLLSQYYNNVNKNKEAMEALEMAQQILSLADDDPVYIDHLSSILFKSGDHGQSLKYAKLALDLAEKEGDQSSLMKAYTNLATAYLPFNEFAKIVEYFNKAIAIAHETGNKAVQATILVNAGMIHKDKHKYQEAKEYFETALPLVEELENESLIEKVNRHLASVLGSLGNYAQALKMFDKAKELAQRLKDERGLARGAEGMAILYAQQNQFATARNYYLEAIALARKIDDQELLCNNLLGLGRAILEMKKLDEANDYILESLQISRAESFRKAEAEAMLLQAIILLNKVQPEKALELASAGRTILETLGITERVSYADQLLAMITPMLPGQKSTVTDEDLRIIVGGWLNMGLSDLNQSKSYIEKRASIMLTDAGEKAMERLLHEAFDKQIVSFFFGLLCSCRVNGIDRVYDDLAGMMNTKGNN